MVQQNGSGTQNNIVTTTENPEVQLDQKDSRRFSIGSEGPSRGKTKWTTV